MITFNRRVAVLTGTAAGIGRSICRMLLEAGARVVIADLDGKAAEALARGLDPTGERAVGYAHDARSSADADALMAFAVERFGSLDILVTAAGLFPPAPLEEIDDEAWRNVLAINLDGVMFCSRAAAPLMGEGSSMVHIASLAGHCGAVRHAHYAAEKGGVLALTRTLAAELAPRDIRANAVSPGLIDTTMIEPVMTRRGDIILAPTPMAGSAHSMKSPVLSVSWPATLPVPSPARPSRSTAVSTSTPDHHKPPMATLMSSMVLPRPASVHRKAAMLAISSGCNMLAETFLCRIHERLTACV